MQNHYEFIKIMEKFLADKITAKEFTEQFFEIHQKDYKFDSSKIENLIDKMFYFCEDYCEYPELRDENDLDEKQLAAKASIVLNDLKYL